MLDRDKPSCSLCTLRTCPYSSPDTNPWTIMEKCQKVVDLHIHCSLSLSTGSVPPHATERKMIVSRFHHIHPQRDSRALVQTPQLMMDVLLLCHWNREHLPSFNTCIILQYPPAFHPSCMVTLLLPCINF